MVGKDLWSYPKPNPQATLHPEPGDTPEFFVIGGILESKGEGWLSSISLRCFLPQRLVFLCQEVCLL